MSLRIIAALVVVTAAVWPAFANESYKFNQAQSTIGFSVHHFLGATRGKFTKFEGNIDIDREHPENSSVTVRIDVHSINTGIVRRDNHLRSPEFFDVEKYPEMSFKSRTVKQTGPQAGDIMGDLTMHGVTKPITLHVKLLSSPDDSKQTRWSVTTEPLQRRDFNLMFGRAAENISGTSQSVQVNIEITAPRAQ